MPHHSYHQCLVNISSSVIIIITPSYTHCKYISLPSYCKYYHNIFVHIIISSLLIHKCHPGFICSSIIFTFHLVWFNCYLVIQSKCSQFITLLSYLCVFFGLRAFNHTLPDWCTGNSYLHYIFLPYFMGCCILALLTWVELQHTPLPHWDSSWASQWLGSCNWIKCPSIHSLSYPGIHIWRLCRESSPGCLVSGVQQAYSAISIVCFTLHPIKMYYIARSRYANRHADQPLHPRCLLVWCLLTTQNFDISREVAPWWSKCHI